MAPTFRATSRIVSSSTCDGVFFEVIRVGNWKSSPGINLRCWFEAERVGASGIMMEKKDRRPSFHDDGLIYPGL